jgi:hypothetical protein
LTYLTALEQLEKLCGYLSAFISGAQLRLHRDQLPLPPGTWKELLVYPYCEGFRPAESKEYQDLERCNTFHHVPINETSDTKAMKILPLIWVFTLNLIPMDFSSSLRHDYVSEETCRSLLIRIHMLQP